MKHFNLRLVIIGLIAGLLLGVISARPITWISIGTVAGVALAFVVRPRKRSCCQ